MRLWRRAVAMFMVGYRLGRCAPEMLEVLRQIEDEFITRTWCDYGPTHRKTLLLIEVQRLIYRAGGSCIGDEFR